MSIDSKNLSADTNTQVQVNNDMDLIALFRMFLRGWKIILSFALLGVLLGLLYGRYLNPTFKSDALIQISDNSSGVSGLGSNISDLIGAETSKAQAEAELIKSRMVLEPVVNLLHLDVNLSDPTVGFVDRIRASVTDTQVNSREGVTLNTTDGQARISQFNVSPVYFNKPFTLVRSDTGFVLSDDGNEFKGLFNKAYSFKGTEGVINITVNDLPVDSHMVTISKGSLQTTTDAINRSFSVTERGKQTGIIQLSMTGSNQQQVSLVLKQIVLTYMEQNQSRGSEETNKTIKFMETQIPTLKEKLDESERVYNKFREQSGTIDVNREAELLVSETYQIDAQLNDLKLKKAELNTYYTAEHPLVVQINDQLTALNARKKEINQTVQRLPEIQREFLKLSEDANINKEIYLTMLKNYEQLKIVKAGHIGFARIIDLPVSTFKPIAPRKLLILIVALMLSTMLGAMLVLLKNILKNTVKDPNQIEAKTGIPVIASIPRSSLLIEHRKNKKSIDRLLAYIDHDSLSYEAIKSLRTHLMFGMPEESKTGLRGKVILVTSESPGAGKSFIAANLTEVLAQLSKRVLIIDADMRLGALHKVFNIEQQDGLSEYCSQEDSTISAVAHATNVDNIDFIPRGAHPHNPSTLLASNKFSDLIMKLSYLYDYIVIDSPPLLAASDGVILARYADKVLMVTRYNKSLEGQLLYAIKQLNQANIQVDGIILNDVQQTTLSKYSYNYSYAYGNNK